MGAVPHLTRGRTRGLVPVPLPAPAHEPEVAAFQIDGDVFLVDLGDFDLDGKTLGAVVRWDGSIGLEYVRRYNSQSLQTGVRAGLYDVKPERASRSQESHACIILGRVIERG